MKNRTILLMTLLALIVGTVCVYAQIVEKPVPGDPVQIDSGKISGKLLPSGIKTYLGVPFAAPPILENRWREPQPVKAWQGVYNADRKAPMCPQRLRNHDINHYFSEESTNEDCLYLNIWTPGNTKAGDRLPVMVFIHGGGQTAGSPHLASYSGEYLAKKGVVFINIAYRLGALGFMVHPELSAENPRGISGNYGAMDMIAALKWINRNIDKFGGNPASVTVMGQSAGAGATSFMQVSPLTKGLMHRAFGMSAGGSSAWVHIETVKEAEARGIAFQNVLKTKSLAEMRALASDRILEAALNGGVDFTYVQDGHVFPAQPSELFARGQANDIPILLSFTRDENTSELREAKTVAEYNQAAQKLFGAKAKEFLALYPVSKDAEVRWVGGDATREATRQGSIRAWALGQLKTGKSPVYMSEFSHSHTYVPGVKFSDHDPATAGAYHTAEVPFYLQTFDAYNMVRPTRIWTDYDRELSSKLSDALVAFSKTGNPNTPAIKWPQFTASNPQFLEFGDSSTDLRTMNMKRMDWMVVNSWAPIDSPPAPPRVQPAQPVGTAAPPRARD